MLEDYDALALSETYWRINESGSCSLFFRALFWSICLKNKKHLKNVGPIATESHRTPAIAIVQVACDSSDTW